MYCKMRLIQPGSLGNYISPMQFDVKYFEMIFVLKITSLHTRALLPGYYIAHPLFKDPARSTKKSSFYAF